MFDKNLNFLLQIFLFVNALFILGTLYMYFKLNKLCLVFFFSSFSSSYLVCIFWKKGCVKILRINLNKKFILYRQTGKESKLHSTYPNFFTEIYFLQSSSFPFFPLSSFFPPLSSEKHSVWSVGMKIKIYLLVALPNTCKRKCFKVVLGTIWMEAKLLSSDIQGYSKILHCLQGINFILRMLSIIYIFVT